MPTEGTPYITPDLLSRAPTGISWDLIPWPQATDQDQYEEQYNVCVRATDMVDSYCNQPLRATIDTERENGPDFRVTVQQGSGLGRVILQRWPITQILAVQVAPAAVFPRQWTQVPTDYWEIENPTLGLYGSSAPSASAQGGQAILIGGSYINWRLGRNGWRISSTVLNGWPHTALTAPVSAGASAIAVDDVTGFGITDVDGFTGASARIFDGSSTESVRVTAVSADTPMTLPNGGGTAQAGPGTLTLASPLGYSHVSGLLVSALPQSIMWASILASSVQALESGISAITIQNVPGSETVGGHGTSALETEYQRILNPFRRMI